MEKLIKKFISGIGSGDGSGNGDGYGYGSGDGYGYGYGSGIGIGIGNGNGSGNGDDYGYGSGIGIGNGNGEGEGNGEGNGNGNGNGSGSGIGNGNGNGSGIGIGNGNGEGEGNGIQLKRHKGESVYYIDGIPCVFKAINKDLIFAKVAVINIKDLSTSLQFVYKFNQCFAHGKSLREAKAYAENKYYSSLDVSERIKSFNDTFKRGVKYDAVLFYKWHSTLTGSCDLGKAYWLEQRNFDLNQKITVEEFISLTKDSYGGEIIKKL